jgi:hypothetical protein
LIGDRIEVLTGLHANDGWQQCLKTNSTYLDCPIGSIQPYDLEKFHVAVHNPSSLDMQSLEFAVPNNMDFDVSFYNQTSESFYPIETTT